MANSASSPTRDGDFYAALGLDPSASTAEIKSAYRRAALDSHPDRPGGDGARFRSLGRAYAVLSDGARRTEYDSRRGGPLFSSSSAASSSPSSSSSLFAEDGVVEVDLASLGVVDAALLSVFGRLGVSIRAAPPPAVLEAARSGRIPAEASQLSWANGNSKRDEKKLPLPARAPPVAVAGSVARGQADWFRITLPSRLSKKRGEASSSSSSSYAIAAHSRAGSRLKLLLFEPGGGSEEGGGGGVWELAASADSVPFASSCAAASSPSAAEAAAGAGAAAAEMTTTTNGQLALLVASDSLPTLEMKPAGTGASLAAAAAAAASKSAGASGKGETPRSSADAHACGGVFRRLDGLCPREPVPPAEPGTELLIAVVGANTFRKSSYSLRAVLLPPNDNGGAGEEEDDESERRGGETSPSSSSAAALLALRSTEEALLAQRRELSELEGRHRAARAALDSIAAEAAAAGARVEALLRSRDAAYAGLFCLNLASYPPSAAVSVRSSSAGGEL